MEILKDIWKYSYMCLHVLITKGVADDIIDDAFDDATRILFLLFVDSFQIKGQVYR